MRPTLAFLVLAGLLAAAGPARAQTWSEPDPKKDVRAWPYRPSDKPCGQSHDRRQPQDKRRDITGLSVDHGAEVVVVTLSMRDVARRDRSTFYELHVRTPRKGFTLDVHPSGHGDSEVFFAEEPDYPNPSEIEDCTFMTVVTSLACEGLTGAADPKTDLVTVSVPRACLGDPPWVRAAGQAYGFNRGDSTGGFTSFSDYWAPRGVTRTGFLPPFGPRVRSDG